MPTEKSPIDHGEAEEAISETVERFYQFKTRLRTAKDGATIADLCEGAGLAMDPNEDVKNTALFRKGILEQYLALHFPRSVSGVEQEKKIDYHIEQLTDYLRQEGARSILWIGGSYGTGRVRSPQSDLDLFFGLPKLLSADARAAELRIFQGLEKIDLVIAQNIAPVEDLLPALETGRGLARLSGMTKDGVEVVSTVLASKILK